MDIDNQWNNPSNNINQYQWNIISFKKLLKIFKKNTF